ncbi:unnamed protein product [Rotaria sp. Silwood1]|nr:unnamed protein product [Rotaria sp. Silwood1]CAF0957632.1 unnamed protein product [Rotaria sp. Silwood1]CAF1122232.1 unnamed protein product [Rotaria sp. Silwood1]CAF3421885.1 unnamed protein product [Rotaria sp. Silwood1]CAF3472519.1 unnamed protein product [Rotaria sp. Silwood1]
MSATDNWIKLYRWWQEHLKSHFHLSSSNMNENHHKKRSSLLHRRSSLMLFRSPNTTLLMNAKKRASFGGVEEHQELGYAIGNGGFRHVRDSIRSKNSRTTRSTATVTNNKRSVN